MTMSNTMAAEHLQGRLKRRPGIAIVAGSGIMRALAGVTVLAEHPMDGIPGLPLPSVEGHGRSLVECSIAGVDVLIATGRLHLYEGSTLAQVTALVDLFADIGTDSLILTNATGGLATTLGVGDVLLPAEIIDMTFRRSDHASPLRPSPDVPWLLATLERCAGTALPVRSGTYVQVVGPSYETRAEIRMLRALGADAVGMSTAVELKRAVARGMRTLVCSMITNTLTDTSVVSVSHAEVLDAASRATDRMSQVITQAVAARTDLSLRS
ncbi:MAG: purine-nucleoside phosphorylase [Candidatus Kapabacteria bacterium]|nr:purine-nucleoside phosphorylase [Candidatus Kapabacteria bacterium]